jgi:hypothetical protein
MPARFFTPAEANALLPEIRPLMGELLERQARVATHYREVGHMLHGAYRNVGSPLASEMVQDFMAMERLLQTIRAHGCIVKDLRLGLVDFLGLVDGREVYLCWRYGEPTITTYHDLDSGFNGRRPL